MDHPTMRQFARYALGEIIDEAELAAFEDHLLGCESCSRKAMAVDLMGSMAEGADNKPALHVAAHTAGDPVALCGDSESRNIVSDVLLPGLDASMVCPSCLAILRAGVSTSHSIN